jgi:hypothetical protein
MRRSKVAPFKEKISEYAIDAKGVQPDAPENVGFPGVVAPAQRAIKGKIITVDMKDRDIDFLYFDLPDDLVAKSPGDVGTIVQLRWEKEAKEGYAYGGNKPAYYQVCYVTVIDKESKSVVADARFQGGEPPTSIDSRSSEGVGSKPEKEVIAFISGLKR